ncbi:MAG: hypothetical protein AABY88_10770 [Pseudomonadota bacterium]
MVELRERPATQAAPARRMTPAVGCFGYIHRKPRPDPAPAPCDISDPSIFAALFSTPF